VERETRFLLGSKEGRYLYRIEDALRRLYQEPQSFGTCTRCGERIPFERLEALPHVRFCLPCKVREEEAQSAA
jgi:DnaK suppressor protein